MQEFNKGTKIFIRLLNKQKNYLQDNISKKIKNNLAKQALETPLIINRKTNLFVKKDKLNELVEKEILSLTGEEKDNFEVLRLIEWLLERLNEHKGLNDFQILEDLFIFFKFDTKYQLDVLGHVIRTNVDCFLALEDKLLDVEATKDLKNTREFQETFSKELKKLNIGCGIEGLEKNVFEYIKTPKFRNNILNVFKNYKTIGEFVNENGQFIGSDDIERFYNALTMAGVKLTAEQKKLIISVISDKYIYQTLVAELEETKSNEDNDKQEIVKNQINRKEKWEALQVVKKYLENDMPTKYITSEEFLSLSNALITLNYSDEEIAKIQKSIVQNNRRLVMEQEEQDFNAAKKKYLTVEDVEILKQIENLINSSESIVNPLFINIKDNFEMVKELLVKVYRVNDDNNPELNDDAELIIIGIAEIRENILNYCYSDYRFSRELVKKDN